MTACTRCGYESSESFNFCPNCGLDLSASRREQRKVVTVLFSDIVGSTQLGESLDPEALRRLLRRYFEDVSAVIARHGGTIEKYIGDAVVAVFGVPLAREDDALRALRAAWEMRARLEALNADFERELGVRIAVRTGIHTGEIVVGAEPADAGFAVSGDTMNVAARLEQCAGAGEILVGAQTRALGGEAIVVEEVEPLEVKGKARPLQAFRLLDVLAQAAPYGARGDAALVGRKHELAVLRDVFARATAGPAPMLATVVGTAGVGKSRLARELLVSLGESALVLVGRCPAYGEGVTFLPLAEALRPVLGTDPRGRVLELLAGDGHAEAAAQSIAAAVGAGDGARGADETFWAVGRLLEALGREQPVVLVLDDVQWAEPTLLDLVEHLVGSSARVALLVLCLTRPDLLDERPSFSAPRENGTIVVLEPLSDDEAVSLVESLGRGRDLGDEDVRRVVDAASGNPLFLEQLLALNAGTDASGGLEIPPTIQALLQARIDRLAPGERTVLESAAIEGREFQRQAVETLLPVAARQDLDAHLRELVRRQLVRSTTRGGFAFAHALVRDAAYSAMPKEVRADLHVRLADHLEHLDEAPPEVIGHHLAQAVRYRRELGLESGTAVIAAKAAELLAGGGARALAQGDDRAAATLLDHACELIPIEEALGRTLRIELGRALAGSGQLDWALEVFSELRVAARAGGDRLLELRSELGVHSIRAQTDAAMPLAELAAAAERTISEFEAQGDERGLARSWFLIHWTRFLGGRYEDSIAASERVIEHSLRAGDFREQLRAFGAIAMAMLWGPTPVEEGLRRCDELVERAGGARLMDAFSARVKGGFCAMTGELELGREQCRIAADIYRELGHPISAIGVVMELQRIERQAGRLDVAERELRDAHARLLVLRDIGYVSWVVGALARVLAEQGELEEALTLAGTGRELQRGHAYAQIASRIAESSALLQRSDVTAAAAVAREALALVEATDMLDLHGDVLLAVADVDLAQGRPDVAAGRLEQAIELYERKGDVVSAARARELTAVS